MMTHLLAMVLAGGLWGGDAKAAPVPVPNAQLEEAARNFRIQVYNSYRLDRPEYDRRIAAWNGLEGTWHAAGAPAEEQPKLIHWLETSLAQSQPDTNGPLPELPRIVAAVPPVTPPIPAPVASPVTLPNENVSLPLMPTAAKPTVAARPGVDAQPVADAKPKVEAKPAGDVKPVAETQPTTEAPQPPVDAAPTVVPQSAAETATPSALAAKKPVDVPWLHSLGKQLGEDLNDAAGAFLPQQK